MSETLPLVRNAESQSLLQGRWSSDAAYAWCERMARRHYENFPVASRAVPKELRRHITAIYAFARTADDFADEGDRPMPERLAALDEWEEQLERAHAGNGEGPVFTALAETIRTTGIPVSLLHDLLTAFRQDARNEGFEMERDLLEYCRYSANPIGRLMLHLSGHADPDRLELSDRICTGLQLANFWQDVSIDLERGRINIPREAMRRFAYTEKELLDRVDNDNFRRLMSYLTDMAEDSIGAGSLLPCSLPPLRLRIEISLTVLGGLRILEKIREIRYGVLGRRPKLGKGDLLRIAGRMVLAWQRCRS